MDFPIRLSGPDAGPLHVQLYTEYRNAILSGRLAPGQRVPSTRHLARQLGISRTTVSHAYEDLIAEGYLQSSRGSGTYVCGELPDESMVRPEPQILAALPGPYHRLSNYGARIVSVIQPDGPPARRNVDFYWWRPGFDAFPSELWARLLARRARSATRATLDYEPDWLGCHTLRQAIAQYLGRARAVQCTPERILITNGSQQSFNLIARVLTNPGDSACVEDPGYPRIRQILASEGARVVPVPVDEYGIQVQRLDSLPDRPRLIYVTPSHQCPTGAVLPLNRRLELVSWARENDVFVIEDDYDSEYRYAARPFPSLQGLDQHGTVLYTGTFSKVLFPSLRVAYIVAPQSLMPVLMRAKRIADRHGSTIEQLALADFITAGHLERHLRRTRMLYNQRRQALVRALRENFGAAVSIAGENAGIHILVRISSHLSDGEILERAAEAGVTITSSRQYYFTNPPKGEFLMGYASLTPEQIVAGVKKLADALDFRAVAPGMPAASV